MTFDSEPPAMFGPDVWAIDDKAEAYDELRRRANDMGFLTVGEALDRLECAKLWNAAIPASTSDYPQHMRAGDPPVAKDWFGRASQTHDRFWRAVEGVRKSENNQTVTVRVSDIADAFKAEPEY